MLNEFKFSVPGMVTFGVGAIRKLGVILSGQKVNKVLIVTDPGIAKAGLVEMLENELKQHDMEYEIYKDVEPNPSVETVNKGAEIYSHFKYEGILALGGGSSIDTAKAIAVKVTNDKEITALEGIDKFENDPLPLFAIPTTAGTGSEVTPFAVITNRQTKYKLTIGSNRIVPKVAILDPTLLAKLPRHVAASTGMDALTHAIEAYISLAASPFTDALAEKAIELIGRNLRLFVANREKNIEAAGNMLIASMLAGIAFGHARLGNVHAMAHPLGGFFNIPHGVANAILLPYVMEYNLLSNTGKFERIAELLGEKPEAIAAVQAVKKLNHDIGIPERLSMVGAKAEAIKEMTVDAMKSGNILVNPVQTSHEDIEELFKRAM
ncbi:MAG: iron-containing alcohol dehydrogenase [Thermoanaerobacteraceae bacterium]|nr:iron-containing alcohol dehydrogenase [Thermoanaerobacteraceae bacterium]